MRLVTFRDRGDVRAGAAVDGGIVDLSARMDGAGAREILATNRLKEAAARAAEAGPGPGI